MLHVEIVQNEWAAGQQRVVARLSLNGRGHVNLESDAEHWHDVALRPFVDPQSGDQVSPDSDPERFIRDLHLHLRGDYLFATEAHDQGHCEHPLGEVVPLTSSSQPTGHAVH